MDRPAAPATTSLKQKYLILYNFLSATLWASILGGTLKILVLAGTASVLPRVGPIVQWTQSLAALEILHSLLHLVRSPLLTTAMQVASRFFLVWGIVHFFPAVARDSLAHPTMLLAWSLTEVVRYLYFAANLAYGGVPPALVWARYNLFFVLYPVGIASECWLVWLASGPAGARFGKEMVWALYAVLAVYVPGSYILFTHMMAQRRKVMGGASAKKTN